MKVCLVSFLPLVSFLFQAPVKYKVEDDTSDKVGILVIILLTLIFLFIGSSRLWESDLSDVLESESS